jgi:hypothetical protein
VPGDPFQIRVTIQPPLEEIAARYNFTERQVKQIGSAAINRTVTSVQSRVVKRLAAEINLRQKDIRPQVRITKANYDKLEGKVTVSRKPVPLIDFIGTRQTKAGVSVQVRRGGERQVLKGTFLARMKTSHLGVFERRRKAGKRQAGGPRFGRLPIDERFGLTLTGYLSHAPAVITEEQQAAADLLQKNVDSQIQRRLAERKPAP